MTPQLCLPLQAVDHSVRPSNSLLEIVTRPEGLKPETRNCRPARLNLLWSIQTLSAPSRLSASPPHTNWGFQLLITALTHDPQASMITAVTYGDVNVLDDDVGSTSTDGESLPTDHASVTDANNRLVAGNLDQ
jgi:hypothetical protein